MTYHLNSSADYILTEVGDSGVYPINVVIAGEENAARTLTTNMPAVTDIVYSQRSAADAGLDVLWATASTLRDGLIADVGGSDFNLRQVVYWLQGETDVAADSAAYKANMDALIDEVELDSDRGDILWVIAILPHGDFPTDPTEVAVIRAAQALIATERDNVVTIDVDDLDTEADDIHLTNQSTVDAGERAMAEVRAYWGLSHWRNAPPPTPEQVTADAVDVTADSALVFVTPQDLAIPSAAAIWGTKLEHSYVAELEYITLNGSNVSAWRDQQLNGNLAQILATNQPLWDATAGPNGRGELQFATNDHLEVLTYDVIAGDRPGFCFVGSFDDLTTVANQHMVNLTSDATRTAILWSMNLNAAVDDWRAAYNNAGTAVDTADQANDLDPHLFENHLHSSGAAGFYVDGVKEDYSGTDAIADRANVTDEVLTVGALGLAVVNTNGALSEFIVLNDEPSGSQRAIYQQRIVSLYDLSI